MIDFLAERFLASKEKHSAMRLWSFEANEVEFLVFILAINSLIRTGDLVRSAK